MGIFENALTSLIDNGERLRLSIMEEARRAFSNFDFDATVDSIVKKGNRLYSGFDGFMKDVKDTVSDFKVIVPFDKRSEKFKYDITGDTLNVKVEGKNGFRELHASIPENCKIDEINHIISGKKKELVIVIPKSIKDDKKVKEAKEAVVNSFKGTAEWLKNALAEKREKAEAIAKSTDSPKAKNGHASKKAKPIKKIVRDEKGRFVSSK